MRWVHGGKDSLLPAPQAKLTVEEMNADNATTAQTLTAARRVGGDKLGSRDGTAPRMERYDNYISDR